MEFRKIIGKQCGKHGYKPSYSLEVAEKECSSDERCSGVYDEYCDEVGPYYLCPKLKDDPLALEESFIDPPSCVYLKAG